jgi:hypothetical protein
MTPVLQFISKSFFRAISEEFLQRFIYFFSKCIIFNQIIMLNMLIKLRFKNFNAAVALLPVLFVIQCFSSCKDDNPPKREAEITAFTLTLGTAVYTGTINKYASKVTFEEEIPYTAWDELNDVAPTTLMVSPEAIFRPAITEKQDFRNPVEYIVTAQNATEKKWTVEFTRAAPIAPPSNAAEIMVFRLDVWKEAQGAPGTAGDIQIAARIDSENGIISYILPAMPDWFTPEKMTVSPAVFQLSKGSIVEPDPDVPQDFTKDVEYTVTAEDGVTKKKWTVKAPSYYLKTKWEQDFSVYSGRDYNPTSIAIAGDYLNIARQRTLINKSDGTPADKQLNVTGLLGNFASQAVPFFVTNDDAGNMIGSSLTNGGWSTDNFILFKWTSATEEPEVLAKIPHGSTVNFGRKVQVLGDVDGKGLIIASEAAQPDKGEHYLWKINNGAVDIDNQTVVGTGFPIIYNGYQILTPLGLEPEPPYYVGTHGAAEGNLLRYGNISSLTSITGPFGLFPETSNGWFSPFYFYQKLFTFDDKNMIAVFAGSGGQDMAVSVDGFYTFAVLERTSDDTHVSLASAIIPWNSMTNPNLYATGSFAMERVGSDMLFYVFLINKGVYCYRLLKF